MKFNNFVVFFENTLWYMKRNNFVAFFLKKCHSMAIDRLYLLFVYDSCYLFSQCFGEPIFGTFLDEI